MRGSEVVRLGRDSSVKQIGQNNTSVANLACAYDVGFGDKKRTQWIEVAVFGKQAERLASYFNKGQQFLIYMKDICTEEYEKRDKSGMGMRLSAVAEEIKFVGKKEDNPQATQPQSFGQAPQSPQFAQQPQAPMQPTPPQPQQFAQPVAAQNSQPSATPQPIAQNMGAPALDQYGNPLPF